MLKGWFDAFRYNGGPTLYTDTNRVAAIEDLRTILVYIAFSTLFIAFLLIFPGIRKERISTLICVTTSLFVGAVLLLVNFGTDWHVASASIASPYRAFSKEKLFGEISVRIGLESVNVTLKASNNDDINYNERFTWIGASQMKAEYRDALSKGLPFPILTVAEYLSHNTEGFSWGGKYRKAGYYSAILLWWSFSLWLLTNILLCMVPCYGAYCMLLTGVSILATNGLYAFMIPKHPPLEIHFETQKLMFAYGWCYWSAIAAGILATLVGGISSILDAFFPGKFSTIFEVDYDTPYRYFVGQDNACPTPSPKPKQSVPKHLPVKSSSATGKSRTLHPPLESTPNTPTEQLILQSPAGRSTDGLVNSAFDDDDDSNLGSISNYGTIVNGKRAVSLRNFGKFAQKEANRKKSLGQRRINTISGGTSPKRSSSQVHIDLQYTSGW